jgi:hypothetical protein
MVWHCCGTRLGLVKSPYAVCLGVVDGLADLGGQALELRELVCAREELALPLMAGILLLLAHLPLACLDNRLLGRCEVHVALVNGVRNLLPCASRFEMVLLLDGGDGQGRGLGDLGVECVHDSLRLAILDLPSLGPLSLCLVNDVLLLAFGVDDGGKRVFLAGDPALAAVLNARSVARAGLDVGAAVQLDVWGACDEAFDVQRGEGDEVVLVVRVDVEDGVADLLCTVSLLNAALSHSQPTLTLMVVLKEAFCAL